VRIGFPDASIQRVFNDYVQLESRYGVELAVKIATRMATLAAARDLGRIPSRPPIRLRSLGGSPGQYSVDLLPPHRLRFSAVNLRPRIEKSENDNVDRSRIEEIEVIGVEYAAVAATVQRRRQAI
jgi:plasmid maintenance system killer protein